MKKLVSLLFVLLLALSCVTLVACGGGGDDTEEATSEATAEDTSEPTAEATAEDTSEPTSEDTEEPTSGSTGGGDSGDYGNLDDLKSYRMSLKSKTDIMGMGPMETEIEMAVVNDPEPKKQHVVMDDPTGMGMDMEVITIGNTTWIKMGNSWMESTDPDEAAQQPMDVGDFMDDVGSDMDYLGDESVNGVNCKHYDVDADIEISSQGVTVTAHYTGEVWIADEGGLPEVMIRSKGKTEMTMQGQAMDSEDEINITDINTSIDISPPPADQISDVPDFSGMLDGMDGMEGFNPENMFPEGFDPENFDIEDMLPDGMDPDLIPR